MDKEIVKAIMELGFSEEDALELIESEVIEKAKKTTETPKPKMKSEESKEGGDEEPEMESEEDGDEEPEMSPKDMMKAIKGLQKSMQMMQKNYEKSIEDDLSKAVGGLVDDKLTVIQKSVNELTEKMESFGKQVPPKKSIDASAIIEKAMNGELKNAAGRKVLSQRVNKTIISEKMLDLHKSATGSLKDELYKSISYLTNGGSVTPKVVDYFGEQENIEIVD
jgi:hypothetical protein